MPAPLASRDEVLDRLAARFRLAGFDGASLADLSAATGLGKSSLYHHFPGGKEEMAEAVLIHKGGQLDATLVAPLREPTAPAARIGRMLDTLSTLYCGGTAPCLMGTFALDTVADRVQPLLKGIFDAWCTALADTLVDAGWEGSAATRMAEDTVVRVQGALILARATGDPGPFTRTLEGLRADLLGGPRV